MLVEVCGLGYIKVRLSESARLDKLAQEDLHLLALLRCQHDISFFHHRIVEAIAHH